MPHITFKNANYAIDNKKLKILNEEISHIVKSPCDWFTFTFLNIENKTFQLGRDIKNEIVFVDVNWFYRSYEVKEKVEKSLNDYLNSFDKNSREIVIIFNNLEKSDYFEY
ncbi:MAG: DUF1904 family protein [Lachnospirales bacterium]